MQQNIAISFKQSPRKRIYGFIVFILLTAFIGRVSTICINGGIGVVKAQQANTEDNQEQNDKQEESKFDSKQLTEFISPSFVHMLFFPDVPVVVGYPMCSLLGVKTPLITVITPPPNIYFS